jgi:hypothetical protein
MPTSADSTVIDRDKSPLLDGHDVVRIAEALRRSPHTNWLADTEQTLFMPLLHCDHKSGSRPRRGDGRSRYSRSTSAWT